MLFPNAKDVWDTATRAFTYINEIEHLDERAITRVGNASTLCGFNVDTETAGVGKRDNILLLDDDKTLSAVIIGVYQAIGKSFA